MPIKRCGYCPETPIAWMEWETIGRPKGAPVCTAHKVEFNKPDNFGHYPTFESLGTEPTPCGH